VEAANLFRGVRAIIFDLDGTLVSTERLKYESYRRAVLHWDRRLDYEFYKTVIGESHRETCQRILAYLHLDVPWTELADARESEYQAVMKEAKIPIIRPALRFLHAIPRAKYHVGLASSSSMDRIEWALKGSGLRRYFNTVVSGENLPNKPQPDLYLAAIETASVVPWDAVVLEDSEAGITSAVRAGARAVAVPNDATRRQDFSRAQVRVDSLAQLIPFL
jgi:HAD superfamily hydrolase (TIGR01509 family)